MSPPVDVLAIAAHPDDVEQTCGGTLIRMAEAGYRTGVLDLTAGDMGTRGSPGDAGRGIRNRRRATCCSAWRGNLGLPDARLENTLAVRLSLAVKIRELAAALVILPYWQGRHPDHYRASEIGYEACFLAGLRKIDERSEPHRPHRDPLCLGVCQRDPSFVVDISAQFERRMAALLSYGPSTENRGGRRRYSPTSRKFGNGWPRWRASTGI